MARGDDAVRATPVYKGASLPPFFLFSFLSFNQRVNSEEEFSLVRVRLRLGVRLLVEGRKLSLLFESLAVAFSSRSTFSGFRDSRIPFALPWFLTGKAYPSPPPRIP